MSLVAEPASTLFTHLLVMGINSIPQDTTLEDIQKGILKPSVLEIHPSSETENMDLPIYLNTLLPWAFPDGFKIYNENGELLYNNENAERYSTNNERKSVRIPKYKPIHSFVMTDEKYSRRYASALMIYEPFAIVHDTNLVKLPAHMFTARTTTIFVPKSIIVISETSCLDAQKQLLKFINRTFVPGRLKDAYVDLEKYIRIPTKYIKRVYSVQRAGFDSILGNQESQEGKQSANEGDLGPVVRESQLVEFYISAFYSLMPPKKSPQESQERIILALKDWTKSKVADKELLRYRITKSVGIEIPTTSFKPLFKRLSAGNIVRLLKAILLERQIIFFSSQPSEIPYVTEALLSLIWPFKWCCIYIPFLPISIWETLHACMPYIVGISAQYKEFIALHIDFTDKIVVDLDNDALYIGEDTCSFPRKLRDYLINQTEEVWAAAKALGPQKSAESWAELTLKAKHYFSTFMLQLINNYLGHYKAPSKKNSKGRAITSASEIFDFETYFAQFDEEHRYFLREAHQTMMLTHLIEETYEILFSQNLNLNPPLVPLAFSPNHQKGTTEGQMTRSASTMNPTSNTTNTTFNALSQAQGQSGLGAFIRELKSVLDTFGKLAKNSKKNIGFVNILDPKILNYVEIVHGCLIKEAMKQFCSPEKVNLLPYLARYYCNYQIDNEESTEVMNGNSDLAKHPLKPCPIIDEEKARAKALEEERSRFKHLNNQIILDLVSMFSSVEGKSLESLSSPSKKSCTYSATPVKHSYETLEVVDLSYLRDSFINSRKVHSQGSEANSRPNHPRPPLEYLSGRMGPRLNIDVQKNHNSGDSAENGAKSAPLLDIVQAAASISDEDMSLKGKKSFSSTSSFALKLESPKISAGLPHKRLESGNFSDLANVVIKSRNYDVQNSELNLSRAQSEKFGSRGSKTVVQKHQENGKENQVSLHNSQKNEKRAEGRRRKKIFEPKSPLKHDDILKSPAFKKSESAPPMEIQAQKENLFCATHMEKTVTGCALEASDISLWEMIVGEKRKSKGGRASNVLQEINLQRPRNLNTEGNEENTIMIKNLDTGEMILSETLEVLNKRKKQVTFIK